MLFTPETIGTLALPNRFVRSATAEGFADEAGKPLPALAAMYGALAAGGVGLIITGHMYVHPSGKAHVGMTGIYTDDLLPALTELSSAAHLAGGRIVVQINHGGMQCSQEATTERIAPSAIDAPFLQAPAREMTRHEIDTAIDAYAQAARRTMEAGFEGVQIHAAHGFLISQFLSPFVNGRTDEWGGDLNGRMRFLREVCRAVRSQVGADYPVLIKLGMFDAVDGGLTLEDGLQIVAALQEMGIDGVEISGGIGGKKNINSRPGIKRREQEAYFRPIAQDARKVTDLPILLVGGLRSRDVMEDVLSTGDADFISLCRPLICEPDLPNRMRQGELERATCISGNRCWPDSPGEGIACKRPIEGTGRAQ
ncbi:MAG: NADH:flavin oxidoreductase [Anaerolineae bacterium]|nr:NADH:flavin oxidoreductase [Anaerolineae bacterium]